MTSTSPVPGEILAGAEAERHELLAQAARKHLENLRTEARRYESEIAHIEYVFGLRVQPVPDVPYWITENRRSDITEALRLLRTAPDISLTAWIKAGNVRMTRPVFQAALTTALDDPDLFYEAWLKASSFLQEARKAPQS